MLSAALLQKQDEGTLQSAMACRKVEKEVWRENRERAEYRR